MTDLGWGNKPLMMSAAELFEAITSGARCTTVREVRREIRPIGKRVLCTITVAFDDQGLLVISREGSTTLAAMTEALGAAANALTHELERRSER